MLVSSSLLGSPRWPESTQWVLSPPTGRLLLSLCVAAFSGGLGGVLSWLLLTALRRFGVGKRRAK